MQRGYQRVKFPTMIHVDTVSNFVRDCRPPHIGRRQDQAPAIAKIARGCATAPARDWISDRHPAKCDPDLRRTGTAFLLEQRARFAFDPAKQAQIE